MRKKKTLKNARDIERSGGKFWLHDDIDELILEEIVFDNHLHLFGMEAGPFVRSKEIFSLSVYSVLQIYLVKGSFRNS